MKTHLQKYSAWLWGITIVVLLAICPLALHRSSIGRQGLRVGGSVPDFRLIDMDGRQLRLSQFAGRNCLLFIFSAWCPDCQRTAPAMKQLYDTLAPKGLVMIGISLNGLAKTKEFVDQSGWTFPVVLGDTDLCVNKYKVHSIPAVLLIDGSGTLRYATYGNVDEGHKLVEIVSHFMRQ